MYMNCCLSKTLPTRIISFTIFYAQTETHEMVILRIMLRGTLPIDIKVKRFKSISSDQEVILDIHFFMKKHSYAFSSLDKIQI